MNLEEGTPSDGEYLIHSAPDDSRNPLTLDRLLTGEAKSSDMITIEALLKRRDIKDLVSEHLPTAYEGSQFHKHIVEAVNHQLQDKRTYHFDQYSPKNSHVFYDRIFRDRDNKRQRDYLTDMKKFDKSGILDYACSTRFPLLPSSRIPPKGLVQHSLLEVIDRLSPSHLDSSTLTGTNELSSGRQLEQTQTLARIVQEVILNSIHTTERRSEKIERDISDSYSAFCQIVSERIKNISNKHKKKENTQLGENVSQNTIHTAILDTALRDNRISEAVLEAIATGTYEFDPQRFPDVKTIFPDGDITSETFYTIIQESVAAIRANESSKEFNRLQFFSKLFMYSKDVDNIIQKEFINNHQKLLSIEQLHKKVRMKQFDQESIKELLEQDEYVRKKIEDAIPRSDFIALLRNRCLITDLPYAIYKGASSEENSTISNVLRHIALEHSFLEFNTYPNYISQYQKELVSGFPQGLLSDIEFMQQYIRARNYYIEGSTKYQYDIERYDRELLFQLTQRSVPQEIISEILFGKDEDEKEYFVRQLHDDPQLSGDIYEILRQLDTINPNTENTQLRSLQERARSLLSGVRLKK